MKTVDLVENQAIYYKKEKTVDDVAESIIQRFYLSPKVKDKIKSVILAHDKEMLDELEGVIERKRFYTDADNIPVIPYQSIKQKIAEMRGEIV